MEERQEYIFDNLGDALRCGLVCELQELYQGSSKKGGENLYASLAFMYMNDWIDEATVSYVKHEIMFNSMLDISFIKTVERISKKIFAKLLERYSFKDLNDLVPVLNQKQIPKWYFEIGEWLVENAYTNPFVYEKSLYYIKYSAGKHRFVKIKVDSIDSEDDLDDSDCQEIMGEDYEAILGFDAKLGRVYLKAYNQKDFFHCYDMATQTFMIYNSQFLDLKDESPFVVTKDGYLARMIGETQYKIKEHHDYEEYILGEKSFLVRPREIQIKCFYPYCVTFDGEIVSADVEECQKFIWEKITWIFHSQEKIEAPKHLSIRLMKETFERFVPSSVRCRNESYIFWDNILDLLSTYIDREDDITRLLYVLYECSNHADKNMTNPMGHIYWQLKNWENKDRQVLEEILRIQDYERLEDMLIENEVGKKMKSTEGRIGTFMLEGNVLKTESFDLKYGVVLGNQIVPQTNLDERCGIVTYDCLNKKYCITSRFRITEKDRLQILKDFKLNHWNTKFVIFMGEKKESIEPYVEKEDENTNEEEWECYLDPELWQEVF